MEERDEWLAVHACMNPKPRGLGSGDDRVPAGQVASCANAIGRDRVWLRSEGPDGEPLLGIYRIVGPR